MPRRPEWLDWELEISEHALERMIDRDFTELDLRRMFQTTITVRAGVWPRWEIRTWFAGVRWKLIVEPDPQRYVLILVIAYPVGI